MKKKFWLNQFPAVLCALAIFIQSSIPSKDIPKLDLFNYDKLIHAGIYFIFTFALARAVRHQQKFSYLAEHWFISTLLLATLYGISDETHQYFTPGRSAEIMDLNADVLGIALAALCYKFFPVKEI
ncbi:MAG: VanZ family protein [Rhizobacter sp.]|nr:VanZ family protein [Chlorobiales bacterium]